MSTLTLLRTPLGAILIVLGLVSYVGAQPGHASSAYDHDKWKTEPSDSVHEFQAFKCQFDGEDDDDGDGNPDIWGVPEWVAYEIKAFVEEFPSRRPSTWKTNSELHRNGIAPNDATYKVSGVRAITEVKGNTRFVRGHMCPKDTAERISTEAAIETHTVLNAVPQYQIQNNGIWKRLENLCLLWADRYDRVWVVCGPVYFQKSPSMWLGQNDEVKAAIPDALYKIVVAENGESIDVLAYLIPNVLPQSEKDPSKYLTTVDRIERLTGVDFLTILDDDIEESVERHPSNPAEW